MRINKDHYCYFQVKWAGEEPTWELEDNIPKYSLEIFFQKNPSKILIIFLFLFFKIEKKISIILGLTNTRRTKG